MDKDELDAVEYFILDVIHRCGNIDDLAAAKQLRCPRSFLLSKLERLWSDGYLLRTEEGYALSDLGREARIPLTYCVSPPEAAAMPAKPPETFDWTALYVPPAGWNEESN